MSDSQFTVAEKGELRWVSRCMNAKQQLCFDVACEYPGIEVWEVGGYEWRCQVRASEYEAMAIAYGGDTPQHAARLGLGILAAEGIAPDALLELARTRMDQQVGANKT